MCELWKRCLPLLLLLLSPFVLNAGEDEVAKELKSLEGKWKAVAFEAGGKALPKEGVPDFVFIVGKGGKATAQMGKLSYECQMSLTPGSSPKTITNEHLTGPTRNKQQYGIYKVEDGKWVVCMTATGVPESDRPKSFDTTGTACVLFTFELVREEKEK